MGEIMELVKLAARYASMGMKLLESAISGKGKPTPEQIAARHAALDLEEEAWKETMQDW